MTGVTPFWSGRHIDAGCLAPRIGDYDWVILAAPSTDATQALIGADELAAMKPSAWLINIARGDMADQEALIEALTKRRIAAVPSSTR